jgi:hypothetical protein
MSAITLTAAKIAAQLDTKTRSYIAAEALTAGQAVYMATAGTVGVADANTGGKEQFAGIALYAAAAAEAVTIAYHGIVDGFAPAGNCGSLLYLSDTAGGLDTAASGSMTVAVGKVILRSDGTKTIYFDVQWLADWA